MLCGGTMPAVLKPTFACTFPSSIIIHLPCTLSYLKQQSLFLSPTHPQKPEARQHPLLVSWDTVKNRSLSSGVVRKDTSARYPEVLNRVWLQLMCCALLINIVPNFGVRSKVGTRLRIGVR